MRKRAAVNDSAEWCVVDRRFSTVKPGDCRLGRRVAFWTHSPTAHSTCAESTMEYIMPGICGLLVILGLVAIIMSRSNWRIPQMILVIFVLIGSLVFFFLAARTLRTRDNWQSE